MIKVLSIFGTRPEAIKLAPVIRELERRPEHFQSRVCVTGQHRQLLDQMLELFRIRPDHDLNVMTPDQSLTDVTVAVLDRMRHVLQAEQPDWVLVQGDTTTTMAGGLASFHHGCRVAHVEAGLRTGDSHDPWPEEMNRRVAGVLADLHFAPTPASAENLRREGIGDDRVFLTGNTVIDALKLVSSMPFDPAGTVLESLPADRRLVVVTMHRRETPPEAVRDLCGAVARIARDNPEVQVVCPVHPNGRVRPMLTELVAGLDNVTLVEPLEYRPLIWLLQRCDFVITDSGGIQEEVTALGKPVLVVRQKTERPESIEAGNAVLVGTDGAKLEAWARRLLREPELYAQMSRSSDPYGSGDAAERIVDVLYQQSLGSGRSRS
jgi:UDP-N-acetylglucosamine 2-epimerase (non-hydrolysing)